MQLIMLRYQDAIVKSQEIPNEVSLVIYISGCPFRCKGCKTPKLQENQGEELTKEVVNMFLDSLGDDITCIIFMGGDIAPDEVNELAGHVRKYYPYLKIGWYSGDKTVTVFTEYQNFDYLKFGPYIKKLGDLKSLKTNQRLYRVEGEYLRDITKSLR